MRKSEIEFQSRTFKAVKLAVSYQVLQQQSFADRISELSFRNTSFVHVVEITSMNWSDKEERTAKKPKSGASRYYPRKHLKTNSLSLSASRPSPNLSRIAVALDNKDVVNYGAVDRRVGQGVRSRKRGEDHG